MGFSPWDMPFFCQHYAREKESLSQGLKPESLLVLNVRTEVRTYLRRKSKDENVHYCKVL